MGVGIPNPEEMLDVNGAIKLGTTTNTNAGTMRWTGTEFQGWDGSQWITFGGGASTQLTEAEVDAFVANNGYLTAEVDGSITNEIQDLQLVGNTLTITNNGSATSIDLAPYVNSLIGLDDAYDNGSTITADAGPVTIDGSGGLDVTGDVNIAGNAQVEGTLTLPAGASAGRIAVSDETGGVTWTDPATLTTVAEGTNWGDYLYWDPAATDWVVGNTEITLGKSAGETNQGSNAIAIGEYAGETNQGSNAIAIGEYAGDSDQGDYAIAIGYEAGYENQGDEAIAIGYEAG
jgi:hypothetical protein